MSRTLPAQLQTDVGASTIQPTYAVTLDTGAEKWSAVTVAGAAGLAGRSSSILTSAGTILVAVVPVTGSATSSHQQSITAFRITNPSTAPTRSAGVVVTTDADQIAGCCLVQTGATIRCFYQRYEASNSNGYVCYRDSTDDGVTWGAEAVINQAWLNSPHGYVFGIAATSTTDLHVSAAYWNQPGNGCFFARSQYTTSWSAWNDQVGPPSPVYGLSRGLAVDVDGSGNFLFANGLQTRAFKAGFSHCYWNLKSGTYSSAATLQVQDSPSLGLNYPYPTIRYDPATGYLYSCVGHYDDGTVSGVTGWYTRLHRSVDGGATWQLFSYLGTAFQFEVKIHVIGTTLYACDGLVLYQMPAATPTTIDASGDVIALHIDDAESSPTTASITLDNSNSTYSTLIPGLKITVKLGYGANTVTTHLLTADSLSFDRAGPVSTVTLHARCALRQWDVPCPKLLTLKNLTIAQMIAALAQEIGQTVATLPATSQFSQVISCFAVSPGETYLTALERVSQTFGFAFFADAGGALRVYDPQSSDPVAWTYGSEIYSSSTAKSADQANVIQVIGANPPSVTGSPPPFAFHIDSTNLLAYNVERMRVVVDKLLTTAAQCQVKAAQVLAEEQRHAQAAEIVAPINPAHELGDVLQLAGSQYRVHKQQWAIELHTQTWHHTIHCTGK